MMTASEPVRLIIPGEVSPPARDAPRDTTKDSIELTVVRRQDGRKCWRVRVIVRESGRIFTLDGRPADWRCRSEAEADRAYLRVMARIMASSQFGGIVGSSHDDVEITGEMLGEVDGAD